MVTYSVVTFCKFYGFHPLFAMFEGLKATLLERWLYFFSFKPLSEISFFFAKTCIYYCKEKMGSQHIYTNYIRNCFRHQIILLNYNGYRR